MASGPDLLASLFSGGVSGGSRPLSRRVLAMKAPVMEGRQAGEFVPPVSRKRTTIWDMHHSVHCSIIGTCLSSAEIRRLLVKLDVPGAETADDHDLHKQGVALAGKAHGGGKFIQKALDHRHETAIRQFAKAKDEAALGRLWDDAARRGDIPGAYWATLSHPLATDALMRKAFGNVHMLSHMIGAANRADIRRLCQLEEENAAQSARIEAQQRQLRDGFTERDGRIRLLNDALGRALARAPALPETVADDARAAREAIRDLEGRLDRETARHARLEGRLEAALRTQSQAETARRIAVRECEDLRRELALAEAQIAGLLAQESTKQESTKQESTKQATAGQDPAGTVAHDSIALQLGGAQVLYVGGRAHQVPQIKAVVERAGGVLLYHDGGIEHSTALLPGLVSRADCTVFPVDCISHDAMGLVKRQCRQAAKPFVPLRTSSLASLLAGLARLELQQSP
jgi:Uncharacterized protein conserved in bacteria (DUF2325)